MNHFLDGLTLGQILNFGGALLALLAVIFSGRAAVGVARLAEVLRKLTKSVGAPDPQHARPTTGETLSEKVEFLGDAQLQVVNNQFLIAQSLRAITDEITAMQGHGKRRLPTDSIPLPKDFPNGK